MAESPLKITRSDEGLSVRYEFDAHYVSDEDAKRIRGYIDQLEAENAKLRNEVDNLLDFEHLTSVAVAYAGCDECGEYKQTMLCLFAENAKLQDENARLRSCLSDDAENARMIMGENAKLRKLVQELYEDQCDECDEWKYRDRMSDLGIEVDG